MAKSAFNRKKTVFTNEFDLNLRGKKNSEVLHLEYNFV